MMLNFKNRSSFGRYYFFQKRDIISTASKHLINFQEQLRDEEIELIIWFEEWKFG